MLAQNFLSAEALGITDEELKWLIVVLGMLERGELPQIDLDESLEGQRFDMGYFLTEGECGTAGCFAGWAHLVSGRRVFEEWVQGVVPEGHESSALRELFLPPPWTWQRLHEITPEQAAVALRSYLTVGSAKWAEALAA